MGMFDDAMKMLENGAKPTIQTNNGDTISSIISLLKSENLTMRMSSLGEVIFQSQKSAWTGNVYSCQLQVTSAAQGYSIATVNDIEKGLSSKQTLDSVQKTVHCLFILDQVLDQFSKMRKLPFE